MLLVYLMIFHFNKNEIERDVYLLPTGTLRRLQHKPLLLATGRKLTISVRDLVLHCMTNGMCAKYTMVGTKDKRSFKGTRLRKLISGITSENNCYSVPC